MCLQYNSIHGHQQIASSGCSDFYCLASIIFPSPTYKPLIGHHGDVVLIFSLGFLFLFIRVCFSSSWMRRKLKKKVRKPVLTFELFNLKIVVCTWMVIFIKIYYLFQSEVANKTSLRRKSCLKEKGKINKHFRNNNINGQTFSSAKGQ